MIPEFAIIGHPNEGKSSVLSTLAEDDSVRVSPTPGETTECRTFPVVIDGRELLRFTDTPGFQNPGRVLSELRELSRHTPDPVTAFREKAAVDPELRDDRELLAPLARGAGIIYVVDGSRPLRNVDRAEMEILRLSGKPRMAIINCKEKSEVHLDAWKNEFRKHFNSFRIFNAHRATYAERILLLEALKSIDQDWQELLSQIVSAFRHDWAARNGRCSDIISEFLGESLSLHMSRRLGDGEDEQQCREKLFTAYRDRLAKLEEKAHQQIRVLFKHNIFNYQLPPHSLLREDIFSDRTWQLLGLTRKQVIIAGGLGGAALGAGVDVAALGHGLGMFTLFGTLAGGLGALFGGENLLGKAQFLGLPLAGETVQIGPAKSIDLLFILLNRTLLYYRHTINWAHGRRDYQTAENTALTSQAPQSFTAGWPARNIALCQDFFKAATIGKGQDESEAGQKFRQLLMATLQEISESE
jgi:hypothetical protein